MKTDSEAFWTQDVGDEKVREVTGVGKERGLYGLVRVICHYRHPQTTLIL